MKRNHIHFSFSILLALSMTAAGCKQSSSGTSGLMALLLGGGSEAGSWGVFMDTRVEGLTYTCGSSSGTTDPAGRFQCPEGEPVTFSIGDIQVGQPVNNWETLDVLSLEDILGATIADNSVRNMARLILTLDDDADLDTGIRIDAAARTACEGRTVDFNLSPATPDDFGAQADVIAIVAALSPPRVLADAATADAHLAELNDRVAEAMAANEFTSFSFEGLDPAVRGVIEGSSVSAVVPIGTDRSRLVATFLTTAVSVKVNGVEQASGTTRNNFTVPVTYTLTAPDGSTRDFTVTVSVVQAPFAYQRIRYYDGTDIGTATQTGELRDWCEDPMMFAGGLERNEAVDQVVGILSFAGKLSTEVAAQEVLAALFGPGGDMLFITNDDPNPMHADGDTANDRWVLYDDFTHDTATQWFVYELNSRGYGIRQPVWKAGLDGDLDTLDDFMGQLTEYKYDNYNRIIQSDVSGTPDAATPLSLMKRTVVEFGVDGVERVIVYKADLSLDYYKTFEYGSLGVVAVNVYDDSDNQIGRGNLSYGGDGKVEKLMVYNDDGGDGDWTDGDEVIGSVSWNAQIVLSAASIMGNWNQDVPVATYEYDPTYGYVTRVLGYSDDEVTDVYSMVQVYSETQPW